MKRTLVMALIAIATAAYADDLTTKTGKIYSNYQISKVTANGLQIMHNAGITTIPFADLPDDLRKKYAAKEKKLIAQQKALRQKAEDDKLLISVEENFFYPKVAKTIEQGILSYDQEHNNVWVLIVGIKGKFADEDFLPTESSEMKLIVLKGGKAAKGSFSCLKCWQIGFFQYGEQILKKFTVNREEALEYLKKSQNAHDNTTSVDDLSQKYNAQEKRIAELKAAREKEDAEARLRLEAAEKKRIAALKAAKEQKDAEDELLKSVEFNVYYPRVAQTIRQGILAHEQGNYNVYFLVVGLKGKFADEDLLPREYFEMKKVGYGEVKFEFLRCWQIGLFEYESVDGVLKTVKKYTVNREVALKYLQANKTNKTN